SADMLVADKDLRDRAPIAARDHLFTQLRIVLYIYLIDHHLLLTQQVFRSLAIRTPIRQIYRHNRLGHFELLLPPAVFASGRLSLTHALRPPSRLKTFVNPSFVNVLAALAPLAPLSQ